MADNFLNRLARNPYAPIDGASVTRVDELGNGYDDWNNLIAPKFEQPQQTWGETALGVATAPARMATALADSISPYGQDGWRLPPIIDEGVNALSAVGDAYTQGMSEDEMRNRALGMAGFMMGGGGLAARPAGGTGMFAGRLAKTADQEALARAERLAAEGADRRAIWDSTGWFQGPDSKWRFEIDDSGASWRSPEMGAKLATEGEGLVGDYLSHADLASAYPWFDKLALRALPGKNSEYMGAFDNSTISLNPILDDAKAMSTLLHEGQHALQTGEGFARGGNLSIKPTKEFVAKLVDEKLRMMLPIAKSQGIPDNVMRKVVEGDVKKTAPADFYKRLAGETEARNVQKRMNMSADERRAAPPWETQDIPDADQIVRLYSNASKEGAIPALMNYDVPDVFYHGTPDASFSKFNIDEIRARAPEQNNGFAGVSMSPYPDEASGYASLRGAAPGMFPLRSDATNPFVWNVDDFYDGKMPKYQFGKLKGDEPATLQRLRGVIPDYKFRGGDFPSYGFGMSEALAAAGYDALDIVHGGKLSERAALAPNTVRSATTGETLFSNADSRPALLAGMAGQEWKPIRAYRGSSPDRMFEASKNKFLWASTSPDVANTYANKFPAWPSPDGADNYAMAPLDFAFENPLRVDAAGAKYGAIPYNGKTYDSDSLARIAERLGHDGLVIENVLDGLSVREPPPATTVAALKPNTVRSATTGETLFSNASKEAGALPALLDMGQEARLARAREMGFDTDRVWYHGTGTSFDAFDTSRPARVFEDDAGRVFLTNDPREASAYAMGDAQFSGAQQAPQVMPLRIKDGNFWKETTYGDPVEYFDGNSYKMAEAQERGYNGLIVQNPDTGARLAVTTDPRNIRSVNAAFDPAKSDSANLLAANADSRPALLGSGQEQDIPDWLLPYLGR